MQAWMWRLTDHHAVIYTDDRATKDALLSYARFPHDDLDRAATYSRGNSNRPFAWQFTFPLSLWNSVVRRLGRDSVTFLDVEKPNRKTTAAEELPAAARGNSGKGQAAAKKSAPLSPPVKKTKSKPPAPTGPLQPMVSASETGKKRAAGSTESAKPALEANGGSPPSPKIEDQTGPPRNTAKPTPRTALNSKPATPPIPSVGSNLDSKPTTSKRPKVSGVKDGSGTRAAEKSDTVSIRTPSHGSQPDVLADGTRSPQAPPGAGPRAGEPRRTDKTKNSKPETGRVHSPHRTASPPVAAAEQSSGNGAQRSRVSTATKVAGKSPAYDPTEKAQPLPLKSKGAPTLSEKSPTASTAKLVAAAPRSHRTPSGAVEKPGTAARATASAPKSSRAVSSPMAAPASPQKARSLRTVEPQKAAAARPATKLRPAAAVAAAPVTKGKSESSKQNRKAKTGLETHV